MHSILLIRTNITRNGMYKLSDRLLSKLRRRTVDIKEFKKRKFKMLGIRNKFPASHPKKKVSTRAFKNW